MVITTDIKDSFKDKITIIGRGASITNKKKALDIFIPDTDRMRGFSCIGTTGVGKTRLIENTIEQDIRKGYNVILLDPKVDFDIMNKIFQVAGEESRINDLIWFNPLLPQYSAGVNPMKHYIMIEEIVGNLVAGTQSKNSDPFFSSVAYRIAMAVTSALKLIADNEGVEPDFSFPNINRYVVFEKMNELAEELKAIDDPEAEHVRNNLLGIISSKEEHYSKISVNLQTSISQVTDGNFGKIIGFAKDNRLINRLERGEGVIFVAQLASMLNDQAAATSGRVLMNMIKNLVGRFYVTKRKFTSPLSVHVDEAQSVFYPGVEELFAKAGSANVMMSCYAQSIAQYRSVLGEDLTVALLDNCNTQMYMKANDLTTSEYVSERIGSYKRNAPTMKLGGDMEQGFIAREQDELYVYPQEVSNLDRQEFYLITYNRKDPKTGKNYGGVFKGITAEFSPTYTDIIFPSGSEIEAIKKTRRNGL